MEHYLKEHLQDLSDRADREGIYTYSDFLTPEEQADLLREKSRFVPFVLFGGVSETERNLVRFGDENLLGYQEDFPVVCLRVKPKNARFAEALTHRDYLGALMSLGIERSLLGDIVVREQEAYIFCVSRIADYIVDSLTQIRRTQIVVSATDAPPEGTLYQTEQHRATVTSLRLDCLAAAFLNRSRGAVDDLLRERKLFLNGSPCENGSKPLKPGDKVSVRGVGKFRFLEEVGTSKKGKCVILFEKYV